MNETVVGIDTETRPSFRKGIMHNVALVQISTWDTCYLFRICRIYNIHAIKQILESTGTLKIGLSLKDDFAGLRRLSPIIPHHYIELQQYATAFGIEEMSLQKIYALLFGRKISNTQQLSNWEAPVLFFVFFFFGSLRNRKTLNNSTQQPMQGLASIYTKPSKENLFPLNIGKYSKLPN